MYKFITSRGWSFKWMNSMALAFVIVAIFSFDIDKIIETRKMWLYQKVGDPQP
jgi:hypothetical protein